jgi:hypothetical protein
MAKVIRQDGKSYRMRRGKLVEIPAEWVGKTLHPQTKRKRASKQDGGKNNGKWVKVRKGGGLGG